MLSTMFKKNGGVNCYLNEFCFIFRLKYRTMHKNSRFKIDLLYFSVNRLGIITLLSLGLTSCDWGLSNNVIFKQIYNASKNKKAVLFFKENGATADNSLQVSILSADHELNKGEVGNVFTVDSNHDSTSQTESSINILWISNDTLKIEYDKRLRTFIKESNFTGIWVIYEQK